jgi:hypothetical protein
MMGAVAEHRPLAPQIAERLTAAEARLAGLERQLGDATLSDQLGLLGGSENLAALTKELREGRETVAALRVAHARALERDAAAEADARLARQRAALAVVESHAAARLEHATKLAAAYAAAHTAYKALREATDAMMSALPEGTALPPGLALYDSSALWLAEQWRLHEPGGPHLPGAVAPDVTMLDQPQNVVPAVAVYQQSNAAVLDALTQQIEPPAVPTAEAA